MNILKYLFTSLVLGNSEIIKENNLVNINIDKDDGIWLTYYTASILYGINYANSLKKKGLLIEPDNPNLAYIDDISTAQIKLWTDQGKYIPYIITGTDLSNIVRISINTLSQETNLLFKLRTTERNYINFVNSGNCGGLSFIGMIGGSQKIQIPNTRNCFGSERIAKGVVMHEIMHALGFSHQQSYPNRDNYVRILTQNIQDNAIFNFEKRRTNIIDSFNLPYDFKSIMHYKSNTFSKNGGRTITKLDGSIPNGDFGGSELSPIDIVKINRLYVSEPIILPTNKPTFKPTIFPTRIFLPTNLPTNKPTFKPTTFPTRIFLPTNLPTKIPTLDPTFIYTLKPTKLPTLPPSPNLNKPCYTIGLPCQFPFIFGGKIFNSCTNDFDIDNRYWCSTKVDSNGYHIRGNWGYCADTCKKTLSINKFIDYIDVDNNNCLK